MAKYAKSITEWARAFNRIRALEEGGGFDSSEMASEKNKLEKAFQQMVEAPITDEVDQLIHGLVKAIEESMPARGKD